MIETPLVKMTYDDYDVEVTKGIKEYCEKLRVKNTTESISKRRELEKEARLLRDDTDRVVAAWVIMFPKRGPKIRQRVENLLAQYLPEEVIYG